VTTTGRPTNPLEQAELVLTVIRHPPSGEVHFDDGSAALREISRYYPDLVARFGEPTLLAAVARSRGRFGADSCHFCYAQALARVRRQEEPAVTKATRLLLGEPCSNSRHTDDTHPDKLRASGAAPTSGPTGPAPLARSSDAAELPLTTDELPPALLGGGSLRVSGARLRPVASGYGLRRVGGVWRLFRLIGLRRVRTDFVAHDGRWWRETDQGVVAAGGNAPTTARRTGNARR
jgi:hypothetical protein